MPFLCFWQKQTGGVCCDESYQKKDMVVNPVHYQRLTVKQNFDTPNTLFDEDGVIDFPMKAADLSRYDEAIYE